MFQSAPVFITPENPRTHSGSPAESRFQSAPVFITPENRDKTTVWDVSKLFQSAPVFITPENTITLDDLTPAAKFQSAPVFITPENGDGKGTADRHQCFNPLRCSSHRRTQSTPPSAGILPVSIRSGVHHTGEPVAQCRASRSAEVSIRSGVHHTGERRGPPSADRSPRVSIRSGVHHTGELVGGGGVLGAGLFQSAPVFITPENAA